MELLLELRYPMGGAASHADVRVDLDPDDTVEALTEALSTYARRRGYQPGWTGAALFRSGVDRPLDPRDRVVDTGLVNGETVTLADAPVPAALLGGAQPAPPPAPGPQPDPYGAPAPPADPYGASPYQQPDPYAAPASPSDPYATPGQQPDPYGSPPPQPDPYGSPPPQPDPYGAAPYQQPGSYAPPAPQPDQYGTPAPPDPYGPQAGEAYPAYGQPQADPYGRPVDPHTPPAPGQHDPYRAAYPHQAPSPAADPSAMAGPPPQVQPAPAPGASGQASPGDLRASGGLTLDVTAGPGVGRVIPLWRDVVVGRADTCTVVIEDPTMSREHFAVQVTPEGQVFVVPNPAATNGTVVAGEELTEPREIQLGDVIHAGSSVFALRSAVSEETRRRDRMGQVPFNRIPYRPTVVWPQQLEPVAPPPEKGGKSKLGFGAMLMPLGMGVGMYIFMKSPIFLIMAGATPIMALFRWIGNKRGGKRRYRRGRADYYKRVEAAAGVLDEALERERHARLTAAPDLAELARQAMLHMPRLWERNRLAGDLLDLRLGLGDLESQVSIEIARGGDDDLRAEGDERLAHQHVVHEVPITVDLLELGVMGLWGDPAQVASSGRALVTQAACLHSPEDLVVAAALSPHNLTGFEWLKWLPHVRSATSPIEGEHLAVAADPTRALLISLLQVAADRSERRGPSSSEPQIWPRVLLLLDEGAEPDRALLSQLLDIAPVFGIHVIWLGESELQVPRQCRAVVACPGRGLPGTVRFTDPTVPHRVVELDGSQPDTARSISRSLAPLRDASAASQTTAIPRIVPLFDTVGFDPVPEAVVERWRTERPYGLEFPIGMSAEGVFSLDLVEQGPHTLIGGTSGAGKSELLQTLVLSLAANYPPTKLNFLFVDYKGGASSAEFRDLPHTVGYVTNLNGRLSLRALTSLRAELQRRMQVMEGKAKDLREMLTVDPAGAPPSLVIVVDEFAALVKEIPDFVAGIVDIAQRGRSLGVHLILATQRPTGVVNENILANTNLRISLRMLDPADSNNIIGSRDAADIPVPLRGRGYARTGPQALVPFQCAWSGAPAAVEEEARAVGVKPFSFVAGDDADGGAADGAGSPAGGAQADGQPEPRTQLEVLVDACAQAARGLSLPPVRRPWVEPLGDVVPLATVLDRVPIDQLRRDPGRVALLGLYDDPENQAQHVAAVDLEASGGLIAFGTGGTGKTTLLRAIAAGMARQGSPEDVQIYGLDFGSRSLDALSDLPHCAAVISGEDVERTTRLLSVLEREIDRRRDVLAEARVENLGALRAQTGQPTFPRLVVLLDSYSNFHTTFDRADRYSWLARFQRLVSAGRQVGVHFVLTNDRRMGMPPPLLSGISSRLALRMATPEELAALGVPTKIAKDAELPAGRGFLDNSIEVQVACVSDDPSGRAQSDAIGQLGAELAATAVGDVEQLPELPDAVMLDALRGRGGPIAPLTTPFGLQDLSLEPAHLDLRRQNMVVMGQPLSGKSVALETIAWGIRASTGASVRLCALGSPASPLRSLELWDDAAFSRTAQAGVAERLVELLDGEDGLEVRAMLFVDAAEDIEGNDVLKPLETAAKSDALRLVVACDASTLNKAYSGWLSYLRRNRSAVLLQPESKADVDAALGIKPDLRPDQSFPAGRGIFVANRQWQLVQVAQRPSSAPGPSAVERQADGARTA